MLRLRTTILLLSVLFLTACTGERTGVSNPTDTSSADTSTTTDASTTEDTATTSEDATTTLEDAVLDAPEDAVIDVPIEDTREDTATPGGDDPSQPGTFDVHTQSGLQGDAAGTAVTFDLCTPSLDGGTQIGPGTYPLVLISPGFQLPRTQYQSYCQHLASWGFIVMVQDFNVDIFGADHTQLGQDTRALLDWALASSTFKASIDANLLATAGHSLGGKISALVASQDDRIDAYVGWDPVDADPPFGGGGISVAPELISNYTRPLLVLGETTDGSGGGFGQACAPTDQNYTQYYNATAGSGIEITLDGADHMDWIDDRSSCGFTCNACQSGSADDTAVRRVTRTTTTAFLLQHLYGRADMATHTTSGSIQPDIDSGLVSLRIK